MSSNGWFKLAETSPVGKAPDKTSTPTPQPPRPPAPVKPEPVKPEAPKPEPQPEPDKKPVAKPAPEPEKKPAPKPEPKPESKPEPKPPAKPEPKPEEKPKPAPKPKPQSKPQPKPKPADKPSSKPEPKPIPKPVAKPDPKPVPKPLPKPVPKPSPAPIPKPVPAPKVIDLSAAMAAEELVAVEKSTTAPRSERLPATPPSGFPDDTEHSQTLGERGPVLVQDTVLHETLETFVHEKRPERAVHVKGFGAFGYYQNIHSMSQYTKAPLFQGTAQVPVMTRFSLAVSNRGTPDTGRNVRGFSTKFYTDKGVFDLLCNHIPVFLVRDAIRFPDSIRAFLPSPVNNLLDPNIFWGFVATAPEATHFVTWLYSDVGTIKSLRHIHGYSVNTYVWRNAAGVRHYVKYHWLPKAGEQYIDRQEAARLSAANPDTAGQDLWDAIKSGKSVEYELNVQLMDPRDAEHLPFDPLDDTKVWDEEDYPLHPVGRLVLNRNPDDYEEQIEKVAFSPSNLQEGIELSDDKMLQGRSFIYYDAQRHRLGPDFRRIPVNKQEGYRPDQQVTTGLGERREGYEMRSDLKEPDNFAQAGERYLMLTDAAQERLIDNIASDLVHVKKDIQSTVISYFSEANAEFGERVKKRTDEYASGAVK